MIEEFNTALAVTQKACAPIVRQRLAAALAAAQDAWLGVPVTWGRDDCALAAANVLRPVLGYDPAARWRGRYTTRRGFVRVLARDGLGSLDAAVAAVALEYGWRPTGPARARAGDVGVLAHDGGRAAALALGNGFWLARRDRGFAVVPSETIDTAWSLLDDV